MMTVTFFSRKLKGEITVSRPGAFYLYADFDGRHPGTIGQQLTEPDGNTIGYGGDDPAEFERIARRWYRRMIGETVA